MCSWQPVILYSRVLKGRFPELSGERICSKLPLPPTPARRALPLSPCERICSAGSAPPTPPRTATARESLPRPALLRQPRPHTACCICLPTSYIAGCTDHHSCRYFTLCYLCVPVGCGLRLEGPCEPERTAPGWVQHLDSLNRIPAYPAQRSHHDHVNPCPIWVV